MAYSIEFAESVKEQLPTVISSRKVDQESLSLSTNPEFMEIIGKARAEFAAGKKVPLEEMKRAVLER